MTTDMMNLRDLVEKAPDADLLREMIGFAAEKLMELEVGAVTGAAYGEKDPRGGRSATATATGTGRPGPGPSSCASRSSEGQLLPGLPRAAAHGREGADGGDPGGLCSRHLDALGRRSGQGHGHVGHLEEPGLAALRRDRRQGEGLPRTGRSKATGPTSGSTPPTSRSGAAGGSSRSPSSSPSASTPTGGARFWAWRSAHPRPSRSGRSSCAS
jgi:putative transposase